MNNNQFGRDSITPDLYPDEQFDHDHLTVLYYQIPIHTFRNGIGLPNPSMYPLMSHVAKKTYFTQLGISYSF
jgi:hypothetical protein